MAAIGCSQRLLGNVVCIERLSRRFRSQRTTFPNLNHNTRRRWTPFCRRRLMPHEYVAVDLRKEVGRLSSRARAQSCVASIHLCVNETHSGVSALSPRSSSSLLSVRFDRHEETFYRREPTDVRSTRCPAD